MKEIAEIDKNLAIESWVKREGLRLYDVEEEPFRIYGVKKENGKFRRMPEEIASKISERVAWLHAHTAGGRVRFVTDSPYISIKTTCKPVQYSHMALSGIAGFDMYAEYDGKKRYEGTFLPPYHIEGGYENVIDFHVQAKRVVTIFFPLYSEVSKLYIGLKEGCVLEKAPDYAIETPVVYYGSSITQGGCCSRPANCYQGILSQRLDCNYINLGFTGGAMAEDLMTDYIKDLKMSVFVMDYDHNALTTQDLQETHSKMFWTIRKANKDLPIIIMPRPKYYLKEEEVVRSRIVHDTYLAAKEAGDEHVYFISGRELMELVEDIGTVDNCHPTDSGFFSMACAVEKKLREIWDLK